MSALTKITDWVDKILVNLLFQWKSRGADDGTIREMFRDLGGEFQDLEDAIFDLLENRTLANATDNMLERIGESVEEPRPISGAASTDDDIYKALVYSKIAQNNSYGTQGDILNILCQLFAQNVIITEFYPARLDITYDATNTFLSASEIKEIIRAVTLEVTLDLTATSSTPFGFEGEPTTFGFGVGELSEIV